MTTNEIEISIEMPRMKLEELDSLGKSMGLERHKVINEAIRHFLGRCKPLLAEDGDPKTVDELSGKLEKWK